MNTHDYDLPVAAVMSAERKRRPYPLRAQDHKDLFEEFALLNPCVMREMELTALSIDSRGMRVSAKYLIERHPDMRIETRRSFLDGEES